MPSNLLLILLATLSMICLSDTASTAKQQLLKDALEEIETKYEIDKKDLDSFWKRSDSGNSRFWKRGQDDNSGFWKRSDKSSFWKRAPGDYSSDSFWKRSGDDMSSFWKRDGDSTQSFWKRSGAGDDIQSFWKRGGNDMQSFWKRSGDHIARFWKRSDRDDYLSLLRALYLIQKTLSLHKSELYPGSGGSSGARIALANPRENSSLEVINSSAFSSNAPKEEIRRAKDENLPKPEFNPTGW